MNTRKCAYLHQYYELRRAIETEYTALTYLHIHIMCRDICHVIRMTEAVMSYQYGGAYM